MHLMAIIGIVVVSLFILVAVAAAIALLPDFLAECRRRQPAPFLC
jgi:hypothetical protein